eukprot:14512031-Alexandrium_andersonii.AAC.1
MHCIHNAARDRTSTQARNHRNTSTPTRHIQTLGAQTGNQSDSHEHAITWARRCAARSGVVRALTHARKHP